MSFLEKLNLSDEPWSFESEQDYSHEKYKRLTHTEEMNKAEGKREKKRPGRS